MSAVLKHLSADSVSMRRDSCPCTRPDHPVFFYASTVRPKGLACPCACPATLLTCTIGASNVHYRCIQDQTTRLVFFNAQWGGGMTPLRLSTPPGRHSASGWIRVPNAADQENRPRGVSGPRKSPRYFYDRQVPRAALGPLSGTQSAALQRRHGPVSIAPFWLNGIAALMRATATTAGESQPLSRSFTAG